VGDPFLTSVDSLADTRHPITVAPITNQNRRLGAEFRRPRQVQQSFIGQSGWVCVCRYRLLLEASRRNSSYAEKLVERCDAVKAAVQKGGCTFVGGVRPDNF
jgi:hypothetical protein